MGICMNGKKTEKVKKKGSYRDEKIALEMEITINL